MHQTTTLMSYFADASLVVKLVMLILLFASITSWAIIFQRHYFFSHIKENLSTFNKRFSSGVDLMNLYKQIDTRQNERLGLASVFHAGLGQLIKLQPKRLSQSDLTQAIERAMRVAHTREIEKLQQHLSFLATVGSVSPFIGLFGTVWGIMASFHALGNVQQATIAMVAPGISEALIATAVGLFAAIPAVIAYNRFVRDAHTVDLEFANFQDEFIGRVIANMNGEELFTQQANSK